MKSIKSSSYLAPLEEYEQEAAALFADLKSGNESAAWRFKWLHPRFRGKSPSDVRAATLELTDAQIVVALEHAFENWTALTEFVAAAQDDGPIRRFETAAEAIVCGDSETLQSLLRDDGDLIRARSTRRHRATLLHYIAANGVEHERQKTPANAVEIAKSLLEAGAEVDALADMYDSKCSTLSMLVSSSHPANAGLQVALAETLLDYGAALMLPGSGEPSALITALKFGYTDTAEALARRASPSDDLATAAGLGRLADVARLLPSADAHARQIALSLAAQHGRVEVVRLLLDAGEDPNRYNPSGFHPHATPLHQAVCFDRANVVRLLIERGARLDIRDRIYQATPLDWAIHCHRPEIAEYLRSLNAPGK